MRKIAIVVAFALLFVPLVSAALDPIQLSLTDCKLNSASYTCGQNAVASCSISTQGNISGNLSKVQSVLYTISGITVTATRTSGNDYTGVWSGSLSTNNKYLTSTLTLDSVRAVASTGNTCEDSSGVEKIGDGCYVSWGTPLSAANSCTCTNVRTETACDVNNTYVVTLTPNIACSDQQVSVMTLSCDFCNPGFVPSYSACNANVSSSNLDLQGQASVSWIPSDGGACCSQTGASSDCNSPLSAPVEVCYLDGLLNAGSVNRGTGSSYDSNKITSGFLNPITYQLDVSTYGTLQDIEPLVWDFNGDSINDILVFTDTKMVMINAQTHVVETSYTYPSGYVPRQPTLGGVTISPAGTKYIDPAVSSTNSPRVVIPFEDSLNTQEPHLAVLKYNQTTQSWSMLFDNYGPSNRYISGAACYHEWCYALSSYLSNDSVVVELGVGDLFGAGTIDISFAQGISGVIADISSTVPVVVQKTGYYGSSPVMFFRILAPYEDKVWNYELAMTPSGGPSSARLSLLGDTYLQTYLGSTSISNQSIRLVGPPAYDYSSGYMYQSIEFQPGLPTGVLHLGYIYNRFDSQDILITGFNLLWKNNRTLSYGTQEGISPFVIQKNGVASVSVSTATASSSIVVAPPIVVTSPVTLPVVYKNLRYVAALVTESFVLDPLLSSMYMISGSNGGFNTPDHFRYILATSGSVIHLNLNTNTRTVLQGATSSQLRMGLTYNPVDKTLHSYYEAGPSSIYGINNGVGDYVWDMSDFNAPLDLFPGSARWLSKANTASFSGSGTFGMYYPGQGIVGLSSYNMVGGSPTYSTLVSSLFPTLTAPLYRQLTPTPMALWKQTAGNSYLPNMYISTCSGSSCIDSDINNSLLSLRYQPKSFYTETYMRSLAYNSTLDVLITEDKVLVGCADGDCNTVLSSIYGIKTFNFDWANPKIINTIGQVINIQLNSSSWVGATFQSTSAVCDPDGAGVGAWIPLWYHSDRYILGLNSFGPTVSISESQIQPTAGANVVGVGAGSYVRQYFSYCDITSGLGVVTNTTQAIDSVYGVVNDGLGNSWSFPGAYPEIIDLDGNLDGAGRHILVVDQVGASAFHAQILYDIDETHNVASQATPVSITGNASTVLYSFASGSTVVSTISKAFRPAALSMGSAQMSGTVDNDVVVPGGWFDVSGNSFKNSTYVGNSLTSKELIKTLGLDTNSYVDVLTVSPGLNSLFFHVSTPAPQAISIGSELIFSVLQCNVVANTGTVQINLAATSTNPSKTTLSIDPGDGQGSISQGKLGAQSSYTLQYTKSGSYTINAKLTDDTNPSNVATASCNIQVDIPQTQQSTELCTIGSNGLFEYTDAITNHGWSVDTMSTLSGSTLRPHGGYFEVLPAFSAIYYVGDCGYTIFNVEASVRISKAAQALSVIDSTGATVTSIKLLTTGIIQDENSNNIGTFTNDGSAHILQIKVDRFNGLIYKYMDGQQIGSTQNKQLIPRQVKIEFGGLWDYVKTYAEGNIITTGSGSGTNLCGTATILDACNSTLMQSYSDIDLRRAYPNVGEYCGSVVQGKVLESGLSCSVVQSGQCDMSELQKIVSYNPECMKETFNYCVSVLENVNSGNAPGGAGNTRGATVCTVLLTAGTVTDGIVGPTLLDLWSYFISKPLLLGILAVVLLIGIAIAAANRRS